MTAWTRCDDCGRQLRSDARKCACGWLTDAGRDVEASPRARPCDGCGQTLDGTVPHAGRRLCPDCYRAAIPTDYTSIDRRRAEIIAANPHWLRQSDESSKDYALRMAEEAQRLAPYIAVKRVIGG